MFLNGQDTPTLISQFLTYPQGYVDGPDALEVMEDLLAIDPKQHSYDERRKA